MVRQKARRGGKQVYLFWPGLFVKGVGASDRRPSSTALHPAIHSQTLHLNKHPPSQSTLLRVAVDR